MADKFRDLQRPGENTFPKQQFSRGKFPWGKYETFPNLVHLQNYEEIFHAFLFSVAYSQSLLFNNRQKQKWKRAQFVLHPLSYGPKDVKGHQKAGRKEGEKSLHATLLEHDTEEEYRTAVEMTWYPSPPSSTFLLDLFQRSCHLFPLNFFVNGTTTHHDAHVQKLFLLRAKQNFPILMFPEKTECQTHSPAEKRRQGTVWESLKDVVMSYP